MPRLASALVASFRGLTPRPGLLGLKFRPGLRGLWFLDLPGLSTLRTVAMSTRVPSARRAKRAGAACKALAVESPGPELGAPSDLGLRGLLFGLLLGLSPRVALRSNVVTEPKFFFSLRPLTLGLPRPGLGPGLARPDSGLEPGLRGLRADLGLRSERGLRGLRGLETTLGGPSSSSSFSQRPSARSTAQIKYLGSEEAAQVDMTTSKAGGIKSSSASAEKLFGALLLAQTCSIPNRQLRRLTA